MQQQYTSISSKKHYSVEARRQNSLKRDQISTVWSSFCFHVLTCMTAGESAVSGVAGGSSLMSLRPPTSDLMLPILSRACSLRFSLFSIRAKACRMASIFLSSRVCRRNRSGVWRRVGGEEAGGQALVHGILFSPTDGNITG